jgi:hypothetical protein
MTYENAQEWLRELRQHSYHCRGTRLVGHPRFEVGVKAARNSNRILICYSCQNCDMEWDILPENIEHGNLPDFFAKMLSSSDGKYLLAQFLSGDDLSYNLSNRISMYMDTPVIDSFYMTYIR